MIQIHLLNSNDVSSGDVIGVAFLLCEMYDKSIKNAATMDSLKTAAVNNRVIVARDENGLIVGMATLVIFYRVGKTVARVEDVVVKHTHRRQGIALAMMKKIIDLAKESGVVQLDLMTHEHRIAAIALYKSIGFKQIDTQDYRLIF